MEPLGLGDIGFDCIWCGDWIFRDRDGSWIHGEENNTICYSETVATPDETEVVAAEKASDPRAITNTDSKVEK